jgi:hypothetical protein
METWREEKLIFHEDRFTKNAGLASIKLRKQSVKLAKQAAWRYYYI